MFEHAKGNISLEQYFKDRYNYTYMGKKDLKDQPFIFLEGVGNSALFWIVDGENRYLYKETSFFVGELISERIAQILGLPCAEYWPATCDGKQGVLSKKFNHEDIEIILGAQIIQEVLTNYSKMFSSQEKNIFDDHEFLELYNIPSVIKHIKQEHRYKYLVNNLNNLEELSSILYLFFKRRDISEEKTRLYTENTMNYLVDMFLFDILTLQVDRHIENWGIGKNSKGDYCTIPLFDNNASFGLISSNLPRKIDNFNKAYEIYQKTGSEASLENLKGIMYRYKPLLSVSEEDIIQAQRRTRKDNIHMLDHFLSISDTMYIEKFQTFVDTLENYPIQRILSDIKELYQIDIDPVLESYVEKIFHMNLELSKATLLKYKKRRRV